MLIIGYLQYYGSTSFEKNVQKGTKNLAKQKLSINFALANRTTMVPWPSG